MLDKELLEQLRGMSREDRLKYFNEHKSDLNESSLAEESLAMVNGGSGDLNPNTASNGADDGNGNYWTSLGFMCHGARFC